jgi:Transcriptional regulatory protein, C terminal/AAA ATPase domain
MPRTLKDILDERAGSLVGRDRELSELLRLVDDDRPLVAMVHGLAGAGKSTLLRALAARARGQGAVVVQLDGAEIEPTRRGFLAALASVIGGPLPTMEEAAGRLAAQGPRSLLVVDTLERLRLLDDWLRRSLVPALPDNVRIVLAGRDPLSPAWTGALGDLLSSIALGNLPAPDARLMLRASGVPEHDVDRLNRLAHGHPLSLRLAASALAARPELSLDQVALPAVVAELTRLYLEGLDPATRRALDAAAVVRRPTHSVMAAMLAEDGEDAWRRLDRLPFAEAGPDGLVLHDTVREAVDAALAAADPQRRRRLRVAAFTQLQSEVREATPAELWRYTSDLLFLADNPLIRDGFFPTGGAAFSIETAAEADRRAIIEIVERHQGGAAAAIARAWWEAVPNGFRVARDRSGAVAAFSVLCDRRDVGANLVARDPVASRWRDDLRRRPLPDDGRALFLRHLLTHEGGEELAPAQAALWLDAKRLYMELRPSLRRTYIAVNRLDTLRRLLEPLGFAELSGPTAELGRSAYHPMVLDFGPASVDGWLARLVAAELGMNTGPRLDPGRRELALDGRRIALTQLEYNLVSHLHEHAGRTVPRAELLTEVWGHQWQGGGNQIEVAVSALRRKLGESAGLVETVRGVGYRWRER